MHEWWPHTWLPRGGCPESLALRHAVESCFPAVTGWCPCSRCKATCPCSAYSMSSLGFQRLMTCFCALPSNPHRVCLNWVLRLLWKITHDSWILGVCWLQLDKDSLGLIKRVLSLSMCSWEQKSTGFLPLNFIKRDTYLFFSFFL